MQFLREDKTLGRMALPLRRQCEYENWSKAGDTHGRLRVLTLDYGEVLHLALMGLVMVHEISELHVDLQRGGGEVPGHGLVMPIVKISEAKVRHGRAGQKRKEA